MFNLNKKVKEDLEFAKLTEQSFKEYKRGKFVSSSQEDFIKKISAL